MGLLLNRYEILGQAGSGSFGTVAAAFDTNLRRNVAIKAIPLTPEHAFELAVSLGQAEKPAEAETAGDLEVGSESDRENDSKNDSGVDVENDVGNEDNVDVARSVKKDSGSNRENAGARVDHSDSEHAGYNATKQRENSPKKDSASSTLPGLTEAQLAGNLGSPHIVGVYDLQLEGNTAYLIMEYVDGMSLAQFLKHYDDELTLDMIANVVRGVADALKVAHKHKVLHLDIKPDNILINSEGVVKVTDFGMAALPDATGNIRAQGGTIGFMPPEQMRGESLDARCDEWALAVVTYMLLAGTNPFRAKTLEGSLDKIAHAELIVPSIMWDELDEDADDVLFYALSPNRENRYANVRDFSSQMVKLLGKPKRGEKQFAELIDDAYDTNTDTDTHDPENTLSDDFDPAVVDPQDPYTQSTHPQAPYSQNQDLYASNQPQTYAPKKYEHMFSRIRIALTRLITPRTGNIAGRIFSAVATALISAFAAINLSHESTIGGVASLVAIAICATLAAIFPATGALTAYLFVSLALMLCGHPVPALVLALATIMWWAFATRPHLDTKAPSNIALTTPLAGAIGATSLSSFASGYFLTAGKAVATAAHAFLVAIILGSLGARGLFTWEPASRALFATSSINITEGFTYMLTNPAVWAVGASWVAGAFVFSICCSRGKRWLGMLGATLAGVIQIAALTIAQYLKVAGLAGISSVAGSVDQLDAFSSASPASADAVANVTANTTADPSSISSIFSCIPPATQIATIILCTLLAIFCCYIFVPVSAPNIQNNSSQQNGEKY